VTTWLRMGAVVAALAISTACNNSNSPGAPSPTRSNFNVFVQPNPITATVCNPQCASQTGGGTFAYSAAMRVEVQETAGIGATVNSVTLTGSVGNVSFNPLVFSSSDITQAAGTNHVSGHATLSIPVTIIYNTPTGTTGLAISISLQATDDRNNQVTANGQANVT
jgi:hypothetical protein